MYVYTCSRRYTEHASSQREEPSREIILTRSHIRATADGYESIKISHREPRIGRGNISNIRCADPSPAPHPLFRSPPSLVSLHHTSPFLVSHRSLPPAAYSHFYYLGARNIFYRLSRHESLGHGL